MLKFRILLIALLLAVSAAKADKIDSLETRLTTTSDPLDKHKVLLQLTEELGSRNTDQAMGYGQAALALARQFGDSNLIERSFNAIGTIYYYQGNSADALENYLSALDIATSLQSSKAMAANFRLVGNVYWTMGKYDKAAAHYKKYMKMCQLENDQSGIAMAYNNLGMIYYANVKYDSALSYYGKSQEMMVELKDLNGQLNVLNNFGNIYLAQLQYEKALDFFNQALEVANKIGNKVTISFILSNIGEVYAKQGNTQRATEYLNESLSMAKELGDIESEKYIYQFLSGMHEGAGDSVIAYRYYKMFVGAKDAILNKANLEKIAELETIYQTEQKEQENAILRKDKEKREIVIYATLTGLILAVVLAAVIFRGYRQKQGANIVLAAQKSEIEKQSKQIMDSIRYAKNIQEAILLSDSEIKKYLSDSFVFFKPKDIVSGDFYWFAKKGNTVCFAAVDCTGHGVPGAFMSMIGNTLLNDIVNDKQITTPSEVLKQLQDGVVASLQQGKEEGGATDGMDIAFCTLNLDTLELQFAGAHNPVFVVKDGELQEIKGNKLFIGDKRFGEEFTDHTMQLEKGDVLYLFSDGFADQMGGPNNKKFYYAPFQQLLTDIHQKPVDEQKADLDQVISEWMGGRKQMDDMLIIGVRV